MNLARSDERVSEILSTFDPGEVVQLTQQLIAIPSPLWHETEVARWIADWMQARGFSVEWQTVPVAGNEATNQAICALQGDGTGPTLMLCGHTDTSDWNGTPYRENEWRFDPYSGEIEEGMLYGLGAINMKAGVASIMMAAEAVRRTGRRLKGDLVVACVAAETGGGLGAVHLVNTGFRPNYCIVAEASNLDVGVVSVGYVQGSVRIKGEFKARFPYINPIEMAASVISALGPSYEPLEPAAKGGWLRFDPHPLIPGYPRMAVRGIEHFQDVTTLSFDLRTVPGMREESVCEDLRGLLDSLSESDPDFQYELVVPMSERQFNMPARDATSESEPVVSELVAAHTRILGKEPNVGAGHRIGATADTCHFKGVGVTCVEYGPGFIPTWPMVDECIEVDQIVAATRVLAVTASALVA